jgi:segregation and condensation protein B|tara:strand:- start:435 stop:1034 length:600 start_codon:yes stop_codon:yes gene_type:complete
MNKKALKNIIEGILLSSFEPISADKLYKVLSKNNQTTKADILNAIDELKDDYLLKEIEIINVASGYRIQAKNTLTDYLSIIFSERIPRYSRALLETLSIITYRQPVTRGDIESIRGVTVSTSIMKTLTDRNWVRIIGYREVPGKPAMFATTPEFLDYFGLESLSQLPELPQIKEPKNLDLALDETTDSKETTIPLESIN